VLVLVAALAASVWSGACGPGTDLGGNWFEKKPQAGTDPRTKRTFVIDEKTRWVDPTKPAPNARSASEDRGPFGFLRRKEKPRGWRTWTQKFPTGEQDWRKSIDDEEQESLLAKLLGKDRDAPAGVEPPGAAEATATAEKPAEKPKDESGFSLGDLFRKPFGSSGVEWTIMCKELRGPEAESQIEQIAAALRRTQGIQPDKVFTLHEPGRSRLYYGRYRRKADKTTGEFDMPTELRADNRMIKELAVDGEHFFLESRMMPAPQPHVGDPAWDIRNNPGQFTLRVAIFYPEGDFDEWKLAAAEYCRELRERGYEAYYRHGDFSSEVCVGSFGSDALLKSRKQGVLVTLPGPEVQKLQAKENLRYELWNLKTLADASNRRLLRASRVVPVDEDEERAWAGR
jgi:hypothetical protein